MYLFDNEAVRANILPVDSDNYGVLYLPSPDATGHYY